MAKKMHKRIMMKRMSDEVVIESVAPADLNAALKQVFAEGYRVVQLTQSPLNREGTYRLRAWKHTQHTVNIDTVDIRK
jgi:hypothetical protein